MQNAELSRRAGEKFKKTGTNGERWEQCTVSKQTHKRKRVVIAGEYQMEIFWKSDQLVV